MTKREYMQQLSRALEGYEQGFVQEILESYEEHFEAGLKSGRSEEEICRELGDIEELLREMGDEVEFKKEERPLPKPVTAISSMVYQLMRDGVSDMHCMSDLYLADELKLEYAEKAPDKCR